MLRSFFKTMFATSKDWSLMSTTIHMTKGGATTSQHEHVSGQSERTRRGRDTHWGNNGRTVPQRHGDVTARTDNEAELSQINNGSNQTNGGTCQLTPLVWDAVGWRLKRAAWNALHWKTISLAPLLRRLKHDVKHGFFGEEFLPKLILCNTKDLHVDERANSTEKTFKKHPHNQGTRPNTARKRNNINPFFYYINYSIFFLSARQHKSCRHLSERGASHIVGRMTSATYRGSATWLICNDWCVNASHGVRPALGCKPTQLVFFLPRHRCECMSSAVWCEIKYINRAAHPPANLEPRMLLCAFWD